MKNPEKLTGAISTPNVTVNYNLTFDDVCYVFSHNKQIENLYKKLRVFSMRDTKMGIKLFCEKHKIDYRLPRIMKEVGYLDEEYKWIVDKTAGKADAIYLSLLLRDTYKKLKSID